ncbi:MAG: hypothetical protein K0R28_5474 [Paenibacillus sp.]|jgi:hypothetical protein|nr:hypothetical protein [Paenibacillus sp.]
MRIDLGGKARLRHNRPNIPGPPLIGTERYVYEWSLLAASGDYERCAGDCSKDLLNYLNYMKDFQWPAVFVIYDIHAFFNPNKIDYDVIRRLKEIQQCPAAAKA